MSSDDPVSRPFEDPWLREGKKTSPIEWERRMYEQTDNPLYVWRAYQICREAKDAMAGRAPFPLWVLAYFDRVVTHIQELLGSPPTKSAAAALAEALEMTRGKRVTAFEDWQKHYEALSLGAKVSLALADAYLRPEYTIENAADDVAQKEGVSRATALHAYERYIESATTRDAAKPQ